MSRKDVWGKGEGLFSQTGDGWDRAMTFPALFQEKLCEFNCNIRAPPKQMVW